MKSTWGSRQNTCATKKGWTTTKKRKGVGGSCGVKTIVLGETFTFERKLKERESSNRTQSHMRSPHNTCSGSNFRVLLLKVSQASLVQKVRFFRYIRTLTKKALFDVLKSRKSFKSKVVYWSSTFAEQLKVQQRVKRSFSLGHTYVWRYNLLIVCTVMLVKKTSPIFGRIFGRWQSTNTHYSL